MRLIPICLLAMVLAIVIAPAAMADADNWSKPVENLITDPYHTIVGAWGSFGDVVILGLFMVGVVLIYLKSQSVAPPLMVMIIGSMALGGLFPADSDIQKVMFIMGVLGMVAMVYYAFVRSRWE